MVFCLKKLHNKTDPSREREREGKRNREDWVLFF
jgi:hypothetical protein